jgi:iduronate 2-sulfatase
LVRYPEGLDTPGRRVSEIVEAVDLVPTLLAGAGLPLPGHLQGTPLLFTPDAETRSSALMEGNGWKTLRTERYRYVIHEDGSERLYDLQAQHGEYHDVAAEGAYSDALTRLRKRLLRRTLQAEEPLPRTWPY